MNILNIIWFWLIAILFIGYVVLDGFDLGVGIVSLFTSDPEKRLQYLKAIGPVWDGNEVWLLTGGGALFAAFPQVYATVFSGFYIAMMAVLLGLIARAVSIEFRDHVMSTKWQWVWDRVFGVSSLLVTILLGVAFGNLLRGLPLNSDGLYFGGLSGLLNPFSLLVGVFAVIVVTLHGLSYLRVKLVSSDHLAFVAQGLWGSTVFGYGVMGTVTFFLAPARLDGFRHNIGFWIFFGIVGVGMMLYPVVMASSRKIWAFLSSSLLIGGLVGLGGATLFPFWVPSLNPGGFAWDIVNAASSPYTLTVMLVIALIGMPLVIGYTAAIYWFFRHRI